jgi:hypothetical protein
MQPHTIRSFFTWRRTRWLLNATTIIAVLALAIGAAIPARALDTSVFELDGNAVTDHSGTGVPDDWDRVCHSVLGTDCSTTNNSNATTVEFASQGATTGTTFTGGGSKDPIDVSSWAWNQGTGGLPGKDILLNGFAARYSTSPSSNCPGSATAGTCSQIFFGMDRFDNSGDAQNGFWFFQNKISLAGSGTSGGGSPFTGVHKDGDLLIVSDFSIGGTISTISVFMWNSACTAAGKPMASCADNHLQLLSSSNAANCSTATSSAAFCGIVNPANGTAAPWPFLDKSGHSSFQQGEFYEGGIDLSNFPGLAGECFASTLAESRSSTSTSATLKSFVLGNFGSCTSKLTTTANPTGSVSIGTGSVSVSDSATLTVGGAANWSGSLTFSLCGPNAGTCATGGTPVGSAQTVNQSTPQPISSATTTVTSVGSYCWRGDFTSSTPGVPNASDNGSNPNECFTVTPVTPTLTTQASGSVQLGNPISDTATLSGTASQPGSPIIGGSAGPAAGGSITFTAFGPNSCSTVAFTSTAVPVSGDGTYGSGSFTPTAVGTYTFEATYTPDGSGNTLGASATACPDPTGHENVLVTDTTSLTTAQNWLPNDSVTIKSAGGSALNGSVTFTLYDNGTCTGNVLYTTGAISVSGSSPQTVATSNTSVKVSTSETVSWSVVYTSNDPNIAGSSDSCSETTALTISN